MTKGNDNCGFLRSVLDANPNIILIFDDKMQIVAANKAADIFIGENPAVMKNQTTGEALHCFNTYDNPNGCGSLKTCSKCIINSSVHKALKGEKVYRVKSKMSLIQNGEQQDCYFMITASPLNYQNQQLAHLVIEDITEFMEMRELLPICSGCKKVRQDGEYWDSVEDYIHKYFDVDFTHGLCPECVQKMIDEIDQL